MRGIRPPGLVWLDFAMFRGVELLEEIKLQIRNF